MTIPPFWLFTYLLIGASWVVVIFKAPQAYEEVMRENLILLKGWLFKSHLNHDPKTKNLSLEIKQKQLASLKEAYSQELTDKVKKEESLHQRQPFRLIWSLGLIVVGWPLFIFVILLGRIVYFLDT